MAADVLKLNSYIVETYLTLCEATSPKTCMGEGCGPAEKAGFIAVVCVYTYRPIRYGDVRVYGN